MYKKILLSTLLVTVLMISGTAHYKSAKAATPFERCQLYVFPFDPNGRELTGEAGNPFIRGLSSDTCNQHLDVDAQTQYHALPPRAEDNPLAANTDGISVPTTRHQHGYVANTDFDGSNYDFVVIDKFEITLQADAKTNIDDFTCQTQLPEGQTFPANIRVSMQNCNGDADFYGGMSIRNRTVGNTKVITWDFGQSGRGRPLLYSENDGDFHVYDTDGNVIGANLRDPNNPYRKMEFHVNLQSKNVNSQIWSATTTSKASIAHATIAKRNFPAHRSDSCDNDGWCFTRVVPRGDVEDVNFEHVPGLNNNQQPRFYWYKIGSVGTVWRKPPPPPPPQEQFITIEKTITGELTCHNHAANLPTLQNGSTGESVRHLQTDLNTALGRAQAVDGNFGPETLGRVLRFQVDQRLTADGIVGPQTWAALADAMNEDCDRAEQVRQFTFDITGPNNFSRNNVHSGERIEVPRAGRYMLSENGRGGFSAGPWGRDCNPNGSIDLAAGQSARCSITNFTQPDVTIEKTVRGGNLQANDFTYHVTDSRGRQTRLSPGGRTLLNGAGTYTLSEAPEDGYRASSWGGDCAADGTFTVAAGEHARCTITNEFQRPQLHVYKLIEGENRGPNDEMDFAIVVTGPGNYRTVNHNGDVLNLDPGTYRVSEQSIPAGYEFVRYEGACARSNPAGSVTLEPADEKDCFIVNRYIPRHPPGDNPEAELKVRKVVITVDGRRVASNQFTLYYRPTAGSRGPVPVQNQFFSTAPATYIISELERAGYTFEGFEDDCRLMQKANPNDPTQAILALGNHERKTCTIVNREQPQNPPRIKVVKTTIGTNTPPNVNIFNFIIHRTDTIQDIGPRGNGITFKANQWVDIQNAGNYRLVEEALDGYTHRTWGGACDPQGNIRLDAGEEAVCSMVNVVTPPPDRRTHLTLNKIILNDTISPVLFRPYYDGGEGRIYPTLGQPQEVETGILYSFGETQQPEFEFVRVEGDCGVTLFDRVNPQIRLNIVAGTTRDNYSCTIVNQRISTPPPPNPPGQLQLVKKFVDANGVYISAPNDLAYQFIFQVTGPNGFNERHHAGDRLTLPIAGTYHVVETSESPANYSFVRYENDCTVQTVQLSVQGDVLIEPNLVKTCTIVNRFDNTVTPPTPTTMNGTLVKTATNAHAGRGNTLFQDDTVNYEVTFTSTGTGPIPTVTLNDFMIDNTEGTSQFHSLLTRDGNAYRDANGNGVPFEIRRGTPNSAPLVPCRGVHNEACFVGDPFNPASGTTLFNVRPNEKIFLKYRGTLNFSGVNPTSCQRLAAQGICGDRFENTAIARISVSPNVPGSLGPNFNPLSIPSTGATGSPLPNGMLAARATTAMFTPCPFILTQGIGDVIIQQDFTLGTDIYKCTGIANIEGPVIRDVPPPVVEKRLIKTGASDIIPTHRLCKNARDDDDTVANLSSNICEMQSTLADDLQSDEIQSAIMENLTRFTRLSSENDARFNLPAPGLITFTEPTEQNNGIFKSVGQDVHVSQIQALGDARTYIIQNGNLIIDNNITFASSTFNNDSFKSVPAVAFIVINGSIQINPNVTDISGIFVSIRGTDSRNAQDGKITGTPGCLNAIQNPLKIDGAVYGDIQPLFACRAGAKANPQIGQAPISINFGGWIYYNMPPILKDLVEIQQEQVAR